MNFIIMLYVFGVSYLESVFFSDLWDFRIVLFNLELNVIIYLWFKICYGEKL